MRKLLVVDDDPGLQKQLKWCFEDYAVVLAEDRRSALAAVRKDQPAVVTLDLGLPPDPANASEGLEALREILEAAPRTKVIVVTGNDDREVAVKAVAQGAYDFYEKPIDPDVLKLIVERAFRLSNLEAENLRLVAAHNTPLAGLIAGSPVMLGVCRTIEKIAPTETTVLLLGESGTGKEVLARALHDLSPRKDQDFIAINCAAIPENLLESELFGYEKGAFTGASKQTKGKIEFADKGTLFLDEIGDLSAALQAKLLRFLQERVIERVGGRSEIAVDTRIICATHQDLRRLIDEGGFREDLFYRISEMTVNIPALRERDGDAVLITRALLDRFESLHKGRIKDLSEATILAINKHDWSGNVRELENRVKRAVIMADGNVLEPEDLELPNPGETVQLRTLREYRDEADLVAVKATLAYADGNIGRVAEILGISRPTVYQILRKFNIDT